MNKTTKKLVLKKLIPGNLIKLKITAIGKNNVGINEFSYGIPILVPNAKLGDTVLVKILKLLTTKKIVIGKLVQVLNSHSQELSQEKKNLSTLTAGTKLEVIINKLGPNNTGIVLLPNTYSNVNKLIVLNSGKARQSSEKISVIVTRIKKNFAFAIPETTLSLKQSLNKNNKVFGKFTLVLPKKAKRYLKHFVFRSSTNKSNVNGFDTSHTNVLQTQNYSIEENGFQVFNKLPSNTIVFVKPNLGAKLGDKVQILITKFFKINENLKYNVCIAKIIKLNPLSLNGKKTLVRATLRQMLKSGMHYGEKAIKCNARMKNYVWTRKKTTTVKLTAKDYLTNKIKYTKDVNKNKTQEARPLIKKGRNIINLLKTRRCLNKALAQLTKYAVKGKTFLFVGTKKAASGLVSRAALFSKKAFFVNTRWLGGMLTNWQTILKSISKIRPILKEKQIIIKDILEKRQTLKARLIQKALLLRKKSKLMLKKGRQLILLLEKQNKTNLLFNEKTNILSNKRKEFLSKGILLLEKQKQLFLKRKELISQSQTLKAKVNKLTHTYSKILTNLLISRKKLRELKSLLMLSNELYLYKQQILQNNQNLYTVKKYSSFSSNNDFIIKNPPQEILNKMIKIIRSETLTNVTSNLNLKSIPNNSSNENMQSKTLIISQLLLNFNLFVPKIKTSIKNIQTYISSQITLLNVLKTKLTILKNYLLVYQKLKTNIVIELQKIKQTLETERNFIRLLRRKLRQISAQKRLIKFLPKLRYLPTPSNKIEQTARFLMKKFVDPKMKYPMDSIYDEKLSKQSKKVYASRKKKWQRLERYLGGISNMTKIQENQIKNLVAIIVGQQEEMNAVRECKKLGIKMFHIVDTNCNPGLADHFIPANDDARNSIKFILGKFLTRIRLAHKLKIRFKKQKV